MVQLSHPYMTTGKTIALTRSAFVGKVMSLLFNMLSRLSTHDLYLKVKVLVAQSCPTLCDSMVYGLPCFPVRGIL